MAFKQLVIHQKKMNVVKLDGQNSVFNNPDMKKDVDKLLYNKDFFLNRTFQQYVCGKHF